MCTAVCTHTHSGALSSAKTIAAVLNLVLDYYSSQAMSYYKSYFINSPLKIVANEASAWSAQGIQNVR